MKKPNKYSLRANLSKYSLNYGQRQSMSINNDVRKCLDATETKTDAYGVKHIIHSPQFEEAVYMLKAEIKKLQARGRRARYGLEDFEKKDIADAKEKIIKVQELEKAYAAYSEMKMEAGLDRK